MYQEVLFVLDDVEDAGRHSVRGAEPLPANTSDEEDMQH
jgi:hypothetical protein